MKKVLILLLCLLMILSFSACNIYIDSNDKDDKTDDTPLVTATPKPAPTEMPEPEPSVMPAVTPHMTAAPTDEPSQTPIGMSPDPVNTLSFHSSYAHMVSYDPARGWADFDYFEMLTGQDAIDWMVSHEGYSEIEAEATVNDWGDGEYWYKNTNPGLRTIDLKDVPIKLMYHPDGTQVTDSVPVDSDVSDVFALYNLDPAYLFDHFFFYIHVDGDGNVTLVEQVYWC